MFVVAIEACPSQACTVTGSTPRASHRHAAVCRRSWIRRPGATADQCTERLTGEACSWWPVLVVNSRSSGPLPSAQVSHQRQHPVRDRHPAVLARLGHLRLHTLGRGPADQEHRHRAPDEVADPHLAQLGPPQPGPRRDQQHVGQPLVASGDRHVERLQLVLSERTDHGAHPAALGDPGPWSTGLVAISRSRTAQAKNADSDARNRRTDDSASPDWFSAINARVTSRSVTAPIWSAASAGGTSRGNAASAT